MTRDLKIVIENVDEGQGHETGIVTITDGIIIGIKMTTRRNSKSIRSIGTRRKRNTSKQHSKRYIFGILKPAAHFQAIEDKKSKPGSKTLIMVADIAFYQVYIVREYKSQKGIAEPILYDEFISYVNSQWEILTIFGS